MMTGFPAGIENDIVQVGAHFSGGWFICSSCQSTFLIDSVDIEYFRKLTGAVCSEFVPYCPGCIAQSNLIGLKIHAHLVRTAGARFLLMKWALRLFGISWPGGEREKVQVRDKKEPLLDGRSAPHEATESTEAK